MRLLSLLLVPTVAIAVAACGGGGAPTGAASQPASVAPASEAPASEAPASEAPASEAPAGEGTAVNIVDFGYDPQTVEVSVGDTVEWTNTGDAPHTVTFDDGEDSGQLASDATYSRTFDAAGEFTYLCTLHPSMTGTVTVSE